MKTIEVVGLGALGLFALSLFSKVSALKGLIFMPRGVRGISFDGVIPVLDFELIVQNTSSQALTINSFAGNLFSGGYLIGNVSNFRPVEIPANGQTVLPVQARLMLLGIVNDVVKAITTNNYSKEIELNAFANVGFIRAPVNVKFKVGNG